MTLERSSGTFPFVDRERQPLDDRGLADAGVSDQDRIVLAPAGQRFAHHAHLVQASDERIDGALGRALVQVRGEALEGILDFFFLLALFRVRLRGPRRGQARRPLDRAVGEVADDVEARHVLDLQDVDRVGLLLAQQGGDHRAGVQLALAGAVSVHRGPLDHAPERDRLLGGLLVALLVSRRFRAAVFAIAVRPTRTVFVVGRLCTGGGGGRFLRGLRRQGGRQDLELVVQELLDIPHQTGETDAGRLQHPGAHGVAAQGEQQVLERHVLVPAR